jgi:sterol O-acyltransferase
VAVLILFAMKVFINDFFASRAAGHSGETFSASIVTVLFASFGKLYIIVPLWLCMFVTHGLMLPIMWAWRQQRIGDGLYSLLYVLHQVCFLFGYGVLIAALDLPVASSMIVLCEQVRMVMKSHSFWRETLRIKHHPQETPKGVMISHSSNSVINSTLLPTFREQLEQFLLFHFVPTLIYRNSYPRTRHVRWSFVGGRLLEVLGCVFYIYVLFATFCIPEYQATAAEPGDARALFVSLFNSVLPGIATYLLAFFGLLHCWMNMFAELTRFADRLFYMDWVSSTTLDARCVHGAGIRKHCCSLRCV